jgi:hypothetical protein
VEKICTILDIKTLAGNLKTMNGLKTAFLKLTNIESWAVAQETCQGFASEAQLGRFFGCNLRNGVPKSFQEFCQRAKASGTAESQMNSALTMTSTSGIPITITVLSCKFSDVSGQLINTGIELAIVNIDSEVSHEYHVITH